MGTAAPLSVLIVEDEPLVRLDLVEALAARGFQTFEAPCAAAAIDILEANRRISVLFTDIEMPGEMNGLALAHYVHNRWPPLFVVISSGRFHPKESEMPNGAEFMAKPYQPDHLDSIVKGIKHRLRA